MVMSNNFIYQLPDIIVICKQVYIFGRKMSNAKTNITKLVCEAGLPGEVLLVGLLASLSLQLVVIISEAVNLVNSKGHFPYCTVIQFMFY